MYRVVLAICLALLGSYFAVSASTPAPPFDLQDPNIIEAGRQLFNRKCDGRCHGQDACEGMSGPRLRGRNDLDLDLVFATINYGRPGTAMPFWFDRLSPEQIWQAAAFVMSVQAR